MEEEGYIDYDMAYTLVELFSLGLDSSSMRCPICLEIVRAGRKLCYCPCRSIALDLGSAYYDKRRGWVGMRVIYDARRILG